MFKILIFEDEQPNIGQEYPLFVENKYDYLTGIIPSDSSGSYLIGSDGNSALVVYGHNSEIRNVQSIIEKALFSKIESMDEDDFNVGGFSYFIWYLEGNKSLMIIQNDEMYAIELRPLLKDLEVIIVASGAHADDILATEFLYAALMKDIIKVKVDDELDESFIEEYTDSDFHIDHLTVNGKPFKKKDKEIVLELAYVLSCQLLRQHEVIITESVDSLDDPSAVESAKRIKRLYDISMSNQSLAYSVL